MAMVTSNEAAVTMTAAGGGGGGAPVLTAVQSGNAAIELNWTYTGAVDEWVLWRKMNGGNFEPLLGQFSVAANLRTYLDAGNSSSPAPTAGNTYTYYITANETV